MLNSLRRYADFAALLFIAALAGCTPRVDVEAHLHCAHEYNGEGVRVAALLPGAMIVGDIPRHVTGPTAAQRAHGAAVLARQQAARAARWAGVRADLQRAGWTPTPVSRAIGLHLDTVRGWWSGRHVPSASGLAAVEALVACAPEPAPVAPAPADEADPVTAAILATTAHWRPLFDAMRTQRDWWMFCALAMEQRLCAVEAQLKIASPRVPAMDVLTAARVAEATGPH